MAEHERRLGADAAGLGKLGELGGQLRVGGAVGLAGGRGQQVGLDRRPGVQEPAGHADGVPRLQAAALHGVREPGAQDVGTGPGQAGQCDLAEKRVREPGALAAGSTLDDHEPALLERLERASRGDHGEDVLRERLAEAEQHEQLAFGSPSPSSRWATSSASAAAGAGLRRRRQRPLSPESAPPSSALAISSRR